MIEKRTKKEFTPYNDYVDRGMALKWRTAFELGELTQSIDKGKEETQRNIPRLPQQSDDEISYYLDQSITQNKLLSIQLNTLDELGRVKPHITGIFQGFADMDILLIGDSKVEYCDIRNISISDYTKWFDTESK